MESISRWTAGDLRETDGHAGVRAGHGARVWMVGAITVVLTLLGWSFVPLVLRELGSRVDPWTNNGWRYGASALLWLPWVIFVWRSGKFRRGIWRSALWPSVANVAGQTCFTAAFVDIDPGLVTFCLRTQLVFVALMAWFLFPAERGVMRSARYVVGVAMLVIGMAPVLLGGELHWEGASLRGLLYAMGSAVGYACYGVFVRKWMVHDHPITAFAVIALETAVGLGIIMLAFGRENGMYVPSLSGWDLFLLGISALVGIAIGHVFYYMSIARLGVSVTSGVLQLQPFIVTAASERIFGERLAAVQWVGGIVAVVGAAIMLTAKGKGGHQVARAASEPGD